MGKRKKSSQKPAGPKKKVPLASTFACLFCNHENSVTVKLRKKEAFADLNCKVCGQSYQTNINYLSAAVDVYSDWVDACDAVAKDAARGAPAAPAASQHDGAPDQFSDDGIDHDNDDLGVMDDVVGEGEYND